MNMIEKKAYTTPCVKIIPLSTADLLLASVETDIGDLLQ